LLKHKRLVSIIATIAFCLSFLAPAIIAPAPAVAAANYTVFRQATIAQVGDKITDTKIQIDIPNVAALATNDVLTIGFPSGTKINAGGFNVTAPALIDNRADSSNTIGAGQFISYPVGQTIIEIRMNLPAGASGQGQLMVNLTDVEITKVFDGEIQVTFSSPGPGFTPDKKTIAKYIGTDTATYVAVADTVTLGTGQKALETIVLQELIKDSVKDGEVIKFKLPPGFMWVDQAIDCTAMWDWQGRANFVAAVDSTDKRLLTVKATITGQARDVGRLYIGSATNPPRIVVDDDSVAKKGDVIVNVSSDKGNVTEQDVKVATYADYEVIATAKTEKEVLAGEYETTLGSINIKETLAGSLLKNRNVTLTLPSGVKWDTEYYKVNQLVTDKIISGTNWVQAAKNNGLVRVDSTNRKLSFTIHDTTTSASNIDLEKLRVVISPDFVGDLNVEVGGNAGIEPATLKVATVLPPVVMKAAEAPDVIIGMQSQVIADVTVTESLKEAIEVANNRDTVAFRLPAGVAFDALPTVKVTDGDAVIDSVDFASASTKQVVLVKFKSTSTKPATFELTDMKVTIDRTVPEGKLELAIDALGSTALQNSCTDPTPLAAPDLRFNVDTIATVPVANVITPAPGDQGRTALFYIGSTVMVVNGANVIMDTAPYIKAGRTYVPVRYLANALGVQDANVNWDPDKKTVTITQEDKSIVLVIGSKTAKINGADVELDVAPEIDRNGRTMLPARHVAEALGFQVGWNETLKQVVIQQAK
jgi:hypothetical protein